MHARGAIGRGQDGTARHPLHRQELPSQARARGSPLQVRGVHIILCGMDVWVDV